MLVRCERCHRVRFVDHYDRGVRVYPRCECGGTFKRANTKASRKLARKEARRADRRL